MIQSDREIMELLINKAYEEKDKKGLLSIQRMLTKSIKSIEEEEAQILDSKRRLGVLSDSFFRKNIDLLTTRLSDFCLENLNKKPSFPTRAFCRSVAIYMGYGIYKIELAPTFVYDLIGMSIDDITRERGIGIITVKKFENKLNEYGLSMYQTITPEQKEILDIAGRKISDENRQEFIEKIKETPYLKVRTN